MTVTMMPDVADKYLLSRVVGVEFPFGHSFGMPHDQEMQLEVARAAVDILDSATGPEARLDIGIEWPVDTKTAYRDWQPSEPSPIVTYNMARRAQQEERRGQ